ncbi:unnamed protein product [Heligmosomoides polygyrus]|uniref:Secreted protein n=1 Tax=Heligmosomoides polygyrus TaxID=6339 RepID=A0A183FQT8_HELPZ|nr:unnamed protein product [Heligmosomoides polygyrus]
MWAAVIVGALILIGLYFYFRHQTSERQGEVSDHEQHHSGYGSSQRQSSQKIDGHGRGGGHGQENEQDVSSHTDTAGGRNRHVTTYRTTTYDRRETRTRTTSSPNHSAINLSPRSRQSLQELELPPLEHPQVRTHYSNVSEKESDGRFTRVEVDDDHMEQSEVYTN